MTKFQTIVIIGEERYRLFFSFSRVMMKDDGSVANWWVVSSQENLVLGTISNGGHTPEEALIDYMETQDKIKIFREEFNRSMNQATNAWKTPIIRSNLNDIFNANVKKSLELSGLNQAISNVVNYDG